MLGWPFNFVGEGCRCGNDGGNDGGSVVVLVLGSDTVKDTVREGLLPSVCDNKSSV